MKFEIHFEFIFGNNYDPNSVLQMDILRNAILNSVDRDTRINLYHYENGPMEDLVRHADELLLRRKSSVNGSDDVTQTFFPKQHLVNEMLQSDIKNLQHEVTKLQETISGKNNSNVIAETARVTRENSSPLPPCKYHQRFGLRAYRCEGPKCPNFCDLPLPRRNQGTPRAGFTN